MSQTLTLQQRALWYWGIYQDPEAVITYKINSSWEKTLSKTLKTQKDIHSLFIAYKHNPSDISHNMIQCLQKIIWDKQWHYDKNERLDRYINQYLDLINKFDQIHFPHLWKEWPVYKWIPDYIPNWFVDFWSDPNRENTVRSWREKMIINKNIIYRLHWEHIKKILNDMVSQKEIVDQTYNYIYWMKTASTPHNNFWWKSVSLSEISENEEMVCRHKAITMQLLMQFFGIKSLLLKCDIRSEKSQKWWAHAANLILIDWRRHLVDPTQTIMLSNWNAIQTNFKIQQYTIDLNQYQYNWEITKQKLPTLQYEKKYRSRNNMYYQIR